MSIGRCQQDLQSPIPYRTREAKHHRWYATSYGELDLLKLLVNELHFNLLIIILSRETKKRKLFSRFTSFPSSSTVTSVNGNS